MASEHVSESELQRAPMIRASLREALLYVALFCGMLASLPVNWIVGSTLFLCCLLSILTMLIVVFAGRGAPRAYGIGYVVANLGYLMIVGYYDPNFGGVPAAATLATLVPLPTTLALNEMYEAASAKCELIREVFMAAGHAYIGVFLGLVGGRFALYLHWSAGRDR